MKIRALIGWLVLLAALVLATGPGAPVSARATERGVDGEPVLLRLKYATFDPLQGEPAVDAALRTDAYPGSGEGAYIVQFKSPIQGAWKEQVNALGARIMDYLPDYAFLVWMDSTVSERVAALDIVRWVGLYQPAYKLSPNLDRTKPLYVVVLFEGADLTAAQARLSELNTPTREVPDEQFVLLLPEGGVDQVATWPEVLWIENSLVPQVSNNIATGIMGAPAAWASLYTGDQQIVTVADTGIDVGVDGGTMHDDFDGRFLQIQSYPVDATWAGCAANIGADDGADDEDSGHGTHVLGSVLGNGDASIDAPGGAIKGTAYGATPTFQAVEQLTTWTGSCGSGTEYALTGLPADNNYYSLFQDAYDWGSRIHSNSWGSRENGAYTAGSQSVDQFVWNNPDMLILFSAGNAGTDSFKPPVGYDGYVDEDSLDSPGTAKNALTVGATDNERDSGGYNPGSSICYLWGTCWPSSFPAGITSTDRISDYREEMAAFSSRGPTDDGRIKPDVVAPGTNIVSARSSEATGTGWGLYAADPVDYMYMGGTSMSTPLTAGAAALVREYYGKAFGHTAPSAALLKATIINSAVDITGYGNSGEEAGQPIPNNHEGWGRVDVGAATSGERQYVDGDSVGTGGSQSYAYGVTSSATPLKITLVWSDYPAELSATVDLVNDLDLEVIDPDLTTTYLGNDFSGGWSTTGGSADRANNVESVYIENPAPGSWTVTVNGFNVTDPGGNPQQPFALVVTGDFGLLPDQPVAAFSGSPTGGEAPLEVSFTDESTGEPTSWLWDFGDGGSSTEQHPVYEYLDAGDYTVSLTVSNLGGSDIKTRTDYIHVDPPPPLAGFTGSPLSGAAPLRVDFADLSMGVIDGWEWSFGDGDTSTLPEPSHIYRTEGSFTVTLTVTNSSGTDTLIRPNYIEVTAPQGLVFLPLVSRSYLSPDPIADGGFEEGPWAEWIEYSSHDLQIVMPEDSPYVTIPAHGGNWLAWLGGYEDEEAYVEQAILFPSDRAYLHFWHWVSSSNPYCSTVQEARVLVDGTPVKTYALCSANNTLHGWVEQVVDLRAYAGRWVSLQFYATTVDASSWYIDDVSLRASGVVADADMSAALDPAILGARKAAPAPGVPQP